MGLDEEQRAEVREDILYFLYRNNYWQKRHTPKNQYLQQTITTSLQRNQ